MTFKALTSWRWISTVFVLQVIQLANRFCEISKRFAKICPRFFVFSRRVKSYSNIERLLPNSHIYYQKRWNSISNPLNDLVSIHTNICAKEREETMAMKKCGVFDISSSFVSISDKILSKMMVGSLATEMYMSLHVVHFVSSHKS